MEKIIVRKKMLFPGYVNSEYGRLVYGEIRSKRDCSKEELIDHYGIAVLMEKLFGENIGAASLKASTLYSSYVHTVNSQEDNNNFIVAYRWDENFAVHIADKIHLYRLVPYHYVCSTIAPWLYTEGSICIGDNFCGESHETIIESLCELSFIDFLSGYRGYKYL